MTAQEVVDFAEGLARIAASGGGAQALARHVAETTGTNVLIEDPDRVHLADAGDITLASTAPGWAIPMYSGSTQLGWISLFGQTTAERAETILRLAAGAVAVELARDADGGRGRRRAFWERLSEGAYHDLGVARDEAATRGITCALHYVAIALESDADGATPVRELIELASQTFATVDADIGMVVRGSVLIVLVPTAREVDASNARTAATLLPRAASKRQSACIVSGGVGRVVPLVEVARSVEQAQAALRIGRRIGAGAHVYVYDDLGAYPLLLEGAGSEALRSFANATLAPLRAYDEKHQTELERTLRIYFAAGQNVKTASEQLNVHRHTVFYRLRQIGEIASRALDNPDDQLTLRMAMAIDAIHS